MKKSNILVLVGLLVVLILGVIALWKFQEVKITGPGIKVEAKREPNEGGKIPQEVVKEGVEKLPSTIPATPKKRKEYVIYSDALKIGWENWSWDSHYNLKVTNYVRSGEYAIGVELQRFGGLALANRAGVSTRGYDRLEFYINGGNIGGQRLKVFVNDRIGNGVRNPVNLETVIPGEWRLISIPLKELDAVNITIFKINISDISGKSQSAFYVDNVMLVSERKTVSIEPGFSKEATGKIKYPPNENEVSRAIRVNGYTEKLPPDFHVWLFVEIGNLSWPKEPEIRPNTPFQVTIYEGGYPPRGQFTLSLYAVSPKGNQQINIWLDEGRETGSYPGITNVSGSFILDSINLTLVE